MIWVASIGYENDVSTVTVIVPVVGTLAAASIAGGIALYVKRLERWNAAELRHSEVRGKAYEAYLAACDRAWHIRIKASVDSYRHREPLAEDEIERIIESINQQAVTAL